jgi:hypothetical protein
VALPYFDVRKYGATGDGKTKDTAALQRAVDECTAGGGGVVYLPPGAYLSGTVILKDNVTFPCESVTNLWVARLEAAAPGNAQPLMRLVNLRDALVSVCSAPSQSGAAVEVAGAESAGVRLLGNDFGAGGEGGGDAQRRAGGRGGVRWGRRCRLPRFLWCGDGRRKRPPRRPQCARSFSRFWRRSFPVGAAGYGLLPINPFQRIRL